MNITRAKNFLAGIMVAASMVALSACSTAIPEQDASRRADAAASLKTLEGATNLTLKKDALSFGDNWTITTNSTTIATMKGIPIKGLGDVYSILSPQEGFMGGESQAIFTSAKTANLYDADRVVTGKLEKEIFSWGATYNLKDNQGNLKAQLKQDFPSFVFEGNITGENGQTAWHFRRDFVSIGANIQLEKKGEGVSALDAVRMMGVANEIYERSKK